MISPSVSVIVPVYNTEKYLVECLDSLSLQTLDNIEIICVDDGSSDHSPDILKQYERKDNRFRILTQPKSGAGMARNLGLQHAKGEYLAFVDSDDFFEKTYLEEMYNRARETSSDIVFCNINFYDHQTKTIFPELVSPDFSALSEKPFFYPLEFPEKLFETARSVVWNKIFRHEMVRSENIWFQSTKINNDIFFNYACLSLSKRISVLNKNLVYWRINHTGNLTSSRKNDILSDELFYILKSLQDFLKSRSLYETFQENFINLTVESIRYDMNFKSITIQMKYHNILRKIWLKELDILNKPESYFHNKNIYHYLQQIINNTVFVKSHFKLIKYKLYSTIYSGNKKSYYQKKYAVQKEINDFCNQVDD